MMAFKEKQKKEKKRKKNSHKSQSEKDAQRMWERKGFFFFLHRMKINTDKTVGTLSSRVAPPSARKHTSITKHAKIMTAPQRATD